MAKKIKSKNRRMEQWKKEKERSLCSKHAQWLNGFFFTTVGVCDGLKKISEQY